MEVVGESESIGQWVVVVVGTKRLHVCGVSQFEVGFEDIVMEGTDKVCGGAMERLYIARFFDK